MTELCGDDLGNDEGPLIECDLQAGHEQDHHAVVTWPRRVRPPVSPPSPMGDAIQRIWTRSLTRALTLPPLRKDDGRG